MNLWNISPPLFIKLTCLPLLAATQLTSFDIVVETPHLFFFGVVATSAREAKEWYEATFEWWCVCVCKCRPVCAGDAGEKGLREKSWGRDVWVEEESFLRIQRKRHTQPCHTHTLIYIFFFSPCRRSLPCAQMSTCFPSVRNNIFRCSLITKLLRFGVEWGTGWWEKNKYWSNKISLPEEKVFYVCRHFSVH